MYTRGLHQCARWILFPLGYIFQLGSKAMAQLLDRSASFSTSFPSLFNFLWATYSPPELFVGIVGNWLRNLIQTRNKHILLFFPQGESVPLFTSQSLVNAKGEGSPWQRSQGWFQKRAGAAETNLKPCLAATKRESGDVFGLASCHLSAVFKTAPKGENKLRKKKKCTQKQENMNSGA